MDLTTKEFRETVEHLRTAKGWSLRRVADEASVPYNWLYDQKRFDTNKLDSKRATMVLDALGRTVSQNSVPIMGSIGAGDIVELIPDFEIIIKKSPQEIKLMGIETYRVPNEFGFVTLHAWVVDKSWEGPLLGEGDLIYTTQIDYENFDKYLECDVLVKLSNGRTFIKKLKGDAGSKKYNLLGIGVHGLLSNVDILWCAEVVGYIKKRPVILEQPTKG